jgi:type IV pilus assembly protein PilC
MPAPTLTRNRSDRELTSYRYLAVDTRGQRVEGDLVAVSKVEAVERIRRQQLRPVQLSPTKTSLFEKEFSLPGFGTRIKGRELAAFTRQFATMVGAGIPLIRTLTVLADQSENPALAKALSQVRFDVESGDSLSRAIRRHPEIFDTLYCSMVAAGEESGALDEVLRQLALSQERSAAVRHKLRSAMSYPIAVLIMVTGVIAVMLRFVVPRFSAIYTDLGGTLPLPTRILVATSDIVVGRSLYLLLFGLAAVAGFRRWVASDRGRLTWDGLKLRMPLIGSLVHKSVLARFGRTMAVLTSAGVPVLDTFAIASQTVGNAALGGALDRVRDAVQRGEAIGPTMLGEPLFPATMVQLISVGEESGTLDQMLSIVGTTYEEEVATSVDGFSALIEPLLMAVIGLVVGAMVISLYLPMFRIIDYVQ